MTLTTRIDLPAPTKVGGGLLGAARSLPSGWERGVQFNGSTCLAPQPWPYCLTEDSPPGSPTVKSADAPSDVASFEPTGIVQGVQCTTMRTDRAAAQAMEALAATAEYQLGLELATGVTTGNPNLSEGALVPSTGVGYADALADLEDAIAGGIFGRLGYIHVTWGDLTRLLAAQVIWRDGRVWRTAAGNTVVTSPGYSFSGELHATAEVFASLSVPETRVDIDRAINQSVAYAEQIGMATFDPCFNVYSIVEVSS